MTKSLGCLNEAEDVFGGAVLVKKDLILLKNFGHSGQSRHFFIDVFGRIVGLWGQIVGPLGRLLCGSRLLAVISALAHGF